MLSSIPPHHPLRDLQMILDARASNIARPHVAMKNATDNAPTLIRDLTPGI